MSDTAIDLSPDATLARVEAAFAPGSIDAKYHELTALRVSGDSMLFEGAVDWSIFLTDSDRRMSGGSESLDSAFEDILACFDHLASEVGPDAEVLIAVQLAGETPPE